MGRIWVCLGHGCIEGAQHRLGQVGGQLILSCRHTVGATTPTHGEVEASRTQTWKLEPFKNGKDCLRCRSATGSVSFHMCGPGQATSSFTDSVSSSGIWECAQEPGSGCKELAQGTWQPICAPQPCGQLLLPESILITEVSGPFSEPQCPHLATLPLRPHRQGTAWMGGRRPPLVFT